MAEAPFSIKTRFTEFLCDENNLHEQNFKEWIFFPGMLFAAENKWWGDNGKREHPHEGLDLCFFRNRRNQIIRLNEKMKIPAISDGIVVRILDDFMGRSIILEHALPGNNCNRFYTIYGHTNPNADLQVGRIVKEGDIVATLAVSKKAKTGILPHLHITLGWTLSKIAYDHLNWESIGNPDLLTLIDPLSIFDRNYRIKLSS